MLNDIRIFKAAMVLATVLRLFLAGIFFMFGLDLQTVWMKFLAFGLAAFWFAHAGYRATQIIIFLAETRREALKDL
jgi:hypothetical protein